MSERRFQKLLKIAYVSIILLLIIVITLSFLLSSKSSDGRTCTSKSCIKAANMILQNIDTSVDPCENFYEFSCGSFLKHTRIPDEQSRIDVFDNLRDTLAYNVADLLAEPIKTNDIESVQKAKKLYKSCLDEARIDKIGETRLTEYLEYEFGVWPILREANIQNSYSTLDKIVKLRLIDNRVFFDLFVSSDPKDPSSSVLRIRQPSWFFNKELYSDSVTVNAYKTYMTKVIQLFNPSNKNLKKEIDNMFELERELALNQIDENLRRNSSYENVTLKQLQKEFPQFDWKKCILNLFSDVHNVTINEMEVILIDDYKYLEGAIKLYGAYNKNRKRDLDNFLIWNFVKDRTSYLPKKFKDVRLDFDKITKGMHNMPSRSLLCSNFALESMEYAVGRLYVSNYFDSKSKEAATEMIKNIQNEFMNILKGVDWMDNESKKNALEKAQLIDIKIGYPDFTYNDTYIDSLYEDYSLNEMEYFENSINILKADTIESFGELRKKKDRKMWISGPAIVNAFYSPPANQICFPAGILQPPFYDSLVPNYLNYGGIGSVIGHEITHGFDDRGRLYDKNGIFHPDGSIWTNNTVKNYKNKVQCIIDQYDKYHSKQINRTLNGIQTQGENIADNGGIKESFKAYQRWTAKNGPEPLLPGLNYNQNQLFFINYGQVWCGKFRDQSLTNRILNGQHSPGEFRIIGPTSNFDEFSKAFSCKAGQKNNPVKKCSVW